MSGEKEDNFGTEILTYLAIPLLWSLSGCGKNPNCVDLIGLISTDHMSAYYRRTTN